MYAEYAGLRITPPIPLAHHQADLSLHGLHAPKVEHPDGGVEQEVASCVCNAHKGMGHTIPPRDEHLSAKYNPGGGHGGCKVVAEVMFLRLYEWHIVSAQRAA